MHDRKEIAAVLEKVPNPVCLLNVKLKIRIVHNSKQFIEHDTDLTVCKKMIQQTGMDGSIYLTACIHKVTVRSS